MCVVFVRRRIDCNCIGYRYSIELLLLRWKCECVCVCVCVRARCCKPKTRTTFYLTEFIIFFYEHESNVIKYGDHFCWCAFSRCHPSNACSSLEKNDCFISLNWMISFRFYSFIYFSGFRCHHKKLFLFPLFVGYVLWWQPLFLPRSI